MIYSRNLLNEFIDIEDIDTESLAKSLTFAGFEVEEFHSLVQATNLVSGQIIECINHPDSDHLHILKVNCGDKIGVLDIVCGAPNARLGLKVIVALVGANLPHIDTIIKKGVIRGVESNGMCCSLLELGFEKSMLAEDSPSLTGIEELPLDFKVGDEEVLKHYGLEDDLLDINILANRPDCLSAYGMARELSTILNRPLKEVKLPELSHLPSTIKVSSETKSCDAFSLLEIDNFEEGKTPLKMQRYLQAMGIRPINLIVDIGNFSMLLSGQPLHMYDLDKMPKKQFVVKDNIKTDFLALDNKEYQVTEGDIVVTDGNTPLCLGGVMGGKVVECDSSTHHIGVEAAHFYHAAIRHTVTRTGLASDSSARFIKSVNPHLINEALRFTLKLIMSLSPNTKIVSYTEYYDVPSFNTKIEFSLDRLHSRLGNDVTISEVDEILKRVDVVRKDDVLYPTIRRLDLKEQCDIEEEVFRLMPPETVKMSLETLPQTHGNLSDEQVKRRNIREHLVSHGFYEVMTYTLVSLDKINSINVFADTDPYVTINPMTSDHMYVRTSILPSLLEIASYNIDHKNDEFKLFEISSIDLKDKRRLNLAIVLSGHSYEQDLIGGRPYDFYDIKGTVASILDMLGIDSKRYTLKASDNRSFHPGRSADIYIGKDLVGTFGEIHPSHDLKGLIICEMALDYLLNMKTSKTKFVPFAQVQASTRDLSFVIDNSVTYKELVTVAKKAGGSLLKDVQVFDIYEKDNIKSIALKLTIVGDHTLQDSEINNVMNLVIEGVTSKMKASLKQ